MKKLLFLINTLNAGGAEKTLLTLVNNIDFNNYDVTVQTVLDEGIYKKSLDKRIKYKTIIKNFHSGIIKKLCLYIISFILSPKFVYKKFVKNDYDCEIAYLEGVPTKIISSSEISNKYAWVHTDISKYRDSLKVFKNEKQVINVYKSYKHIVCVSNSVKKGVEEVVPGINSIKLYKNPYDTEKIRLLGNKKVSDNYLQCFRFVSVGRLVKEKGFDRLLESCRLLKDENYIFHIDILGDGNEKDKLNTMIQDYKLSDYVSLRGFENNPYKYIKNSNAVICSSLVEGYPSVIIESLILGVPIISTKCGGPEDIAKEAGGILLVNNDTLSIMEGIKLLLTNDSLYKKLKQEAKESSNSFEMITSIKLFYNIIED